MKTFEKIRDHSIVILLTLLCVSGYAQNTDEQGEKVVSTDTIAPGVQGSPNPMADNNYVLVGEDLLDDAFPSSWPLFGSGIRMKVGGYVKADLIRDFDYVGDRFEFELGSIAVKGTPERDLGGITTFHAKESRVNFDFRSKAKWKNGKEFPLQVFVEIDWFFDSESARLNTRLRQAYGVIGRLLVGRTWNTSSDLTAIPGTIDFSGGDAMYGGRFAQIRWQDKISNVLSYAVALEDPGGQVDNPSDIGGAFRPQWPNVAAMIRWKSQAGSTAKLGLDVFPISWTGSEDVPNENKTGYSLNLMSRILIPLKHYNDSFVWGVGLGEGQGHRIVALSWDGKASGVVSEDDLRINPALYAYAGYNHYWSKSLNSNLSVAYSETSLGSAQSDDTIQKASSLHANLIWFPYPMVSTGVEYMWGMRENKGGAQGTANRIQFMAKFKFN